MSGRRSLFPSHSLSESGSKISDKEGFEIALEMTPGEPLRFTQEMLTEHLIQTEYAMICRDPIDGLYAVPSAKNMLVWYGLLFIRRGVYKGAVLRFNLHLPDDFPSTTIPRVYFDLDVFHPYVDPNTRELVLKRYFGDGWDIDRYHLYHILLLVQRVFFTFDADSTVCANPEAAKMLRGNKDTYREKASELIKKSRSVIYDPVDDDDPNAIRLSPWDASIHEPLRQRLIGGLTDSEISAMSMLGSLGSKLNDTTLFEPRGKVGFSWLSPADMCYMVERRKPTELDMKIPVRESSINDKNMLVVYSGEKTAAVDDQRLPEIAKLDLSSIGNDGDSPSTSEHTRENVKDDIDHQFVYVSMQKTKSESSIPECSSDKVSRPPASESLLNPMEGTSSNSSGEEIGESYI